MNSAEDKKSNDEYKKFLEKAATDWANLCLAQLGRRQVVSNKNTYQKENDDERGKE